MNIIFDMDNTLTDELGATVRPGIINLLKKLQQDKHTLILWTNSNKERALYILADHNLTRYFTRFIFRENYDPENKNVLKDIREVNGDIIIDDDRNEIRFNRKNGKKGILIKPYRKGKSMEEGELDDIYKQIKKKGSFFKRIF